MFRMTLFHHVSGQVISHMPMNQSSYCNYTDEDHKGLKAYCSFSSFLGVICIPISTVVPCLQSTDQQLLHYKVTCPNTQKVSTIRMAMNIPDSVSSFKRHHKARNKPLNKIDIQYQLIGTWNIKLRNRIYITYSFSHTTGSHTKPTAT